MVAWTKDAQQGGGELGLFLLLLAIMLVSCLSLESYKESGSMFFPGDFSKWKCSEPARGSPYVGIRSWILSNHEPMLPEPQVT